MAMADLVETRNLSSRQARNGAGVVFLISLVAGAVSVVWYIATGQLSQVASHWTPTQFVQGDLARSLADELTHAPVPVALADAERALTWLLVGSLGPRVRQGCGQWLFLEDELVVHPDAAHSAQARLNAVVKVRDRLRGFGIELVIATVPDKSRVQRAQLCNTYRPVSFQTRLSDWEAGLAERAVRHASLLPALEALEQAESVAPFLKSDTHWSEAGAQAAAQTVAATVGQVGVALTPHQRYVSKRGETQTREGDLVRLAGLDWLPAALQPPPDSVSPTHFSTEESPVEQSSVGHDAAADLFGDANLPSVALIGSSYSRTSSFAQFLEAVLETPVPNLAQDGGDFWRAAKAYLGTAELRDAPPRVVIWEIPERVLQMPISQDELAWMEGLETAHPDR